MPAFCPKPTLEKKRQVSAIGRMQASKLSLWRLDQSFFPALVSAAGFLPEFPAVASLKLCRSLAVSPGLLFAWCPLPCPCHFDAWLSVWLPKAVVASKSEHAAVVAKMMFFMVVAFHRVIIACDSESWSQTESSSGYVTLYEDRILNIIHGLLIYIGYFIINSINIIIDYKINLDKYNTIQFKFCG